MDNLKEKVVIAVSSRALFDLEEEHALFEEKGYKAFRDHQVRYQNTPLRPGVAFPFVRRLLALNELYGDLAPFRVIALSRNSPETAQRFFHSCRHYRLPISAGGFTSGHSTYPYLAAFNASLFLSANPENVRNAIAAGQPAGLVMPSPVGDEDDDASTTKASASTRRRGSRAFIDSSRKRPPRPIRRGPCAGSSSSCRPFSASITTTGAPQTRTSSPPSASPS